LIKFTWSNRPDDDWLFTPSNETEAQFGIARYDVFAGRWWHTTAASGQTKFVFGSKSFFSARVGVCYSLQDVAEEKNNLILNTISQQSDNNFTFGLCHRKRQPSRTAVSKKFKANRFTNIASDKTLVIGVNQKTN